jgi:hypothetical protein
MSDDDKQKVELSNNVSNKEALKKIEEKNLLDKVNLKRPDCVLP